LRNKKASVKDICILETNMSDNDAVGWLPDDEFISAKRASPFDQILPIVDDSD
jgi:hypothetical protein